MASYGGYEYGGNGNNFAGGGGGGGGGGYGGSNPMGGYIPDAGGGAGGAAADPKAAREKQSIIPMTIRMLLETPEPEGNNPVILEGYEVHQIHVVGCIYDKEEKSTFTIYRIEDGTGRCEVKFHSDESNAGARERQDANVTNTYVAVTGKIDYWQGKRSIKAYDVKHVDDFNSVTLHYLECIHAQLQRVKGSLNTPAGAQALARPGPGVMMGTGARDLQGSGSGYGGMAQGMADSMSGLSVLEEKILDVCRVESAGQGFTIPAIHSNLPGYSFPEIKTAVARLNDDGHLYTTSEWGNELAIYIFCYCLLLSQERCLRFIFQSMMTISSPRHELRPKIAKMRRSASTTRRVAAG
jgi:replication factor A2